jgi:hypothetical protein
LDTANVRVWSEEIEPGVVHLTWERPDDGEEHDPATDRRVVAAALHVRQRIESCKPDGEGMLVRYDPEQMDKQEIAAILREALAIETDLKTRSNDLVRRTPTYLNLAQKLALDDRVSPLPDAARNMAASRGSGIPRAGLPLHMIPGFRLATRLHMILPALQSLASWSRDAPPDVVEHHLASAGLSREQLDMDHATAQEMMLYAREISGEKAAQVGKKAGELTAQASVIGKQWWQKAREKRDEFVEARDQAAQPTGETIVDVQVEDGDPDESVERADERSEA